MDNKEQNGFSYTYSAKEQAEIKKIRDKYTPLTEAEDKMERLRKLDAGVTVTAQIVALSFGIPGALILGFGMSLCLSNLGEMLGLLQNIAMLVGVIIGAFGGILTSLAYPIYNVIVKVKRKKITPEIIRLTDELLK